MNRFSVNGVNQALPQELTEVSSLSELVSHLRRSLNSDNSLISSIRIDGTELQESEETSMGAIPLNDLRSIEIFTAHPSEIAKDTLMSLLSFIPQMIELSSIAANEADNGKLPVEIIRLMEGISIFTESVASARKILRIESDPDLNLLEADLLSILQETLNYHRAQQWKYLAAMLREHLPENLCEWRDRMIPSILRSSAI